MLAVLAVLVVGALAVDRVTIASLDDGELLVSRELSDPVPIAMATDSQLAVPFTARGRPIFLIVRRANGSHGLVAYTGRAW